MQIHVVASGDSLYTIAGKYGTTVDALINANELDAPNQLVIGQALVVPIIGRFYFVQPGDSLFSIAARFGMSYQELARINNIPVNTPLSVGLRIYIPPRSKRDIVSNAYIEPIGGTVSQTLENAARKNTPYLTYLAPFSYQVNRDGSLAAPPLNDFKQIADSNSTNLMMAVTTLEEGAFSEELGHIIVTVQEVQNRLLDNIINTAQQVGFTDVHFDFEFLQPEDRDAYSTFLAKAKERLSAVGLLMSVAVAPKVSAEQTGGIYGAHDYGAIGAVADLVVLMTYEWGYSAGPAMAVSPIDQVRRVVDFALTKMPPSKILLGQNLYGYDWTLPFVQGGSYARAVSPQQAIALAREHNVAIEYDTTAQAPFFHYWDADGKQHEVWFEDARSIQAKFDMIKELNLRGISYWKLGLSFPQNWLLLQDNFNIVKKSG